MSALITGLVVAALSGFGTASIAFPDVAFPEVTTSQSAISANVLAGPPSDACRGGAALCREAYEKLEKCELARAAAPKVDEANAADACAAARAEADARCRDTTSACDTDGSRLPPAR